MVHHQKQQSLYTWTKRGEVVAGGGCASANLKPDDKEDAGPEEEQGNGERVGQG